MRTLSLAAPLACGAILTRAKDKKDNKDGGDSKDLRGRMAGFLLARNMLF